MSVASEGGADLTSAPVLPAVSKTSSVNEEPRSHAKESVMLPVFFKAKSAPSALPAPETSIAPE